MSAERAALIEALRGVPDEALTRLQYLEPATGCFNQCSFCSQGAGREVWQLTPKGLEDLFRALGTRAQERGLRIARDRSHRPGTVFPYEANDAGSYPYFDEYLQRAQTLGLKVRLSTVGYSSLAPTDPLLPNLSEMHRNIATNYAHVLDGFRISLTPYTIGWMRAETDRTSRKQFTADLANALGTYRKAFDELGHGASTAAVELRFAPLLQTCEVIDTHIAGHHVISAGSHLLVSIDHVADLPLTRVKAVENNRPVLTEPATRYVHITSDGLPPTPDTIRQALADELTIDHHRREVDLYLFRNADGPYYAVEPNFTANGRFAALQVYLREGKRKKSGYTDANRWFLNTLLDVKEAHGIHTKSDDFPHATWGHVDEVFDRLHARAQRLTDIYPAAAKHIRDQVIPLIETYKEALDGAGYPASTFFSPRFTLDTGQIVNQGRALGIFRGLSSTPDEPMTPREERGYGAVSLSSERGNVWRLAPVPFSQEGTLAIAVRGQKNDSGKAPSLVLEELDPRHLRNFDRDTGERLRRYELTGVEMEHQGPDEALRARAFPGIR